MKSFLKPRHRTNKHFSRGASGNRFMLFIKEEKKYTRTQYLQKILWTRIDRVFAIVSLLKYNDFQTTREKNSLPVHFSFFFSFSSVLREIVKPRAPYIYGNVFISAPWVSPTRISRAKSITIFKPIVEGKKKFIFTRVTIVSSIFFSLFLWRIRKRGPISTKLSPL